MNLFLAKYAVIKWLETPSVYHIKKDDLYELDEESFRFLQKCASANGCSAGDKEFIEYCTREDILTADRVQVKRPPVIKSPVPSLRYLELQITDKCNLNCRHCYIGGKSGKELPPVQISRILHEFDEMQGLRVLITGGEPLLHSGFAEINRILPEFFFRKILFTNGLLLSGKISGGLNVDEIQFSIDGLEDAHDSIRGKGTFRSAMEAIRKSIDSGFEVSVSTMVHAGNLGDFEEMDRIFRKMGIKDWSVDVPCITGSLSENKQFQVTPDNGGEYLRYGFGEGLHAGASGFGCGLHLMAVMADGRAAKCTFYADRPVGNIDEGLRTCWERIRPIRLVDLECDCREIEACRGGCRYRAELLGNPFGKDLYRCRLYDIIKKQT